MPAALPADASPWVVVLDVAEVTAAGLTIEQAAEAYRLAFNVPEGRVLICVQSLAGMTLPLHEDAQQKDSSCGVEPQQPLKAEQGQPLDPLPTGPEKYSNVRSDPRIHIERLEAAAAAEEEEKRAAQVSEAEVAAAHAAARDAGMRAQREGDSWWLYTRDGRRFSPHKTAAALIRATQTISRLV